MFKDLNVLAIETSCDETSCSIIKNGRNILSNIVFSQIEIHEKFGGVVPELASRMHVEAIYVVVEKALKESSLKFSDIDLVAVTYGPGLVGALLVGIQYAKGIAYAIEKPLIGVNHIEGHICSNYIAHKELKPPYLCLVVSGGNTFIIHVKDYVDYEVLGETKDDAAGEAYDKVARVLGYEYPGGPKIDEFSKFGDEDSIKFTRAKFSNGKNLDFSFSGIKSAVINYLHNSNQKGIEVKPCDVAASFQKSVVDYLIDNTLEGAKIVKLNKISLVGGVSANSYLRKKLGDRCNELNYELYYPTLNLCTDNAAMIGSAGYYRFINGFTSDFNLNAVPNLKFNR